MTQGIISVQSQSPPFEDSPLDFYFTRERSGAIRFTFTVGSPKEYTPSDMERDILKAVLQATLRRM